MEAMRRMAGSKPISSMRSTSSSTRILTPSSRTSLRLRKSSSRPGVATIKLRAAADGFELRMFRHAADHQRNGLRVAGPDGPEGLLDLHGQFARGQNDERLRFAPFHPLRIGFCSISTMGMRKLRVLPVPVCAVASTSRPSSAGGIAPACTGVGVSNWLALSRASKGSESENCEN